MLLTTADLESRRRLRLYEIMGLHGINIPLCELAPMDMLERAVTCELVVLGVKNERRVKEAADEVDRLRSNNEALRSLIHSETEKFVAEIASLRAEVSKWQEIGARLRPGYEPRQVPPHEQGPTSSRNIRCIARMEEPED
jgi:hypothetical protein